MKRRPTPRKRPVRTRSRLSRSTPRRFARNDARAKSSLPTALEQDTADKLLALGRDFFGRSAVKDVFAWHVGNEVRFAFFGDPESMMARMAFDYEKAPIDATRGRFDVWVGRAFGIRVETRSGYAEPALTHQDGTIGIGGVLEGLTYFIASDVLKREDGSVDVTVIPEPGYPWAGPGTRYYSARTKKVIAAKRPAWEVPIVVRDHGSGDDVKRLGADWCRIAPRSEPANKYAAGYFTIGEGTKQESVFVTHTIELRDDLDAEVYERSARAIRSCKGLLFPSLAVAPIPASNFGPATLVADPMLVLRDLKPYRLPRSGWPKVVTYSTDAFTDTTRTLVSDLSAKLYDQLTGNMDSQSFNYYENMHLFILGPKIEVEEIGHHAVGTRVLTNTSQLAREIGRRFRVWRGAMDDRQFAKAMASVQTSGAARSAENYAYLEAKAHTVVPLKSFVAAFVPDFAKERYTKFLKSVGYTGKVHVMPTTDEERRAFVRGEHSERADLARYNYGWRMAEAMKRVLTPRALML